jgi:hypothetical protein
MDVIIIADLVIPKSVNLEMRVAGGIVELEGRCR